MTDEVYRLEGGEKAYEELAEAVTIAEAKAEAEESSVRVYRKTQEEFEPVVKVFPDGSSEHLD